MKAIANIAVFIFATCTIIAVFGFVMKFYWMAFMAGWGVL